MRLVEQHVIVHSRHVDSMCPQSADHWVHLAGEQNKISGDCSLALPSWLKVDGGSNSHRRWNLHRTFSYLLQARNGELQDASVDLSGVTESLLYLPGVEVDALLRCPGCCCCGRRSLRQSKGGGERTP